MTSSDLLRRAAPLAVALGLLALSGEAAAQRTPQDIETARQLYNQGIELRDQGDVPGALDKFRAAHALGNTPLTGLELCKTYAALRRPVEAREVCLGVARIGPLPQETARSQEARAEAARLAEDEKPKIGALRLKVAGIPPGREALVLVDGAAVPPAALGEPRAVNPGAHVVTARVEGGPETRATVETREGETRELELTVQAPSEPAPSGPVGPPPSEARPREARSSALTTAALVTAGVGVTLGSVAGLLAIGKEGDLADKCVDKKCGRELHGELDSAELWGNVSTVSFLVGGAALGVALFSILTTPSRQTAAAPRVRPLVGAGGVGLDGAF